MFISQYAQGDSLRHQKSLNRDGSPVLSFFLFFFFFFFFFLYPGRSRLMFTCVLGRDVATTVSSVPKPFGGR